MPVNLENDMELQRVNAPGADNEYMSDYWSQVSTIIQGVRGMRAAGQEYLPKFPHEDISDYNFRLKCSTMTNVYSDVLHSLSEKPFSEESTIKEKKYEWFQEDVDGAGNHLTVFLSEVYFHGINSAIDWILVEYPNVQTVEGRPMTIAEEKAKNIRPYWTRVPAQNMLEPVTRRINGKTVFEYIRFLEDENHVRIIDARNFYSGLGPIEWYVCAKNNSGKWEVVGTGYISIDVIPIVPFITGKRFDRSFKLLAPLRDAADLQIELYQKETSLKNVESLTCYPMLTGNGVTPDMDPAGNPKPTPTGPNVVLFAPTNENGHAGSWGQIQADAGAVKIIMEHIQKIIERIRELGKQPLTAQSGNITRINAQYAAGKANSAAQKWAFDLKDAAELAMIYVCKWLKSEDQPQINVYTDFPIEGDEDKAPEWLLKMRAGSDLSQKTLWAEMKRRGVLSAEFSADDELNELSNEYPSDPIDSDDEFGSKKPTVPDKNEKDLIDDVET